MPRIYLAPTGLHSRAMLRVVNALRESLPPSFEEVNSLSNLGPNDVQVLHVISQDALSYAGKLRHKYVVIQYCFKTAGGDISDWREMWYHSLLVWSYYDLSSYLPESNFGDDVDWPFLDAVIYHAPLGIDKEFINPDNYAPTKSRNAIVTTGFVSGPGAEAIEEVWQAALQLGMHVYHVGCDRVQGAVTKPNVSFHVGLSDKDLAFLYSSCGWVSALRYVEGFEMPAVEDMRRWYGKLARYVPDGLVGDDLVHFLRVLFASDEERTQ